MNSQKDKLIYDIQTELDSMRLGLICEAGLSRIYRELYETALNRVGDRETHDQIRDLLVSLDGGVPFGIHEWKWKHKCDERGYGLSQDELYEWAEGEVADMVAAI